MDMYYIYCYTNKINQHKYVGRTNNLKRRYREHWNNANNPSSGDYNTLFHKKLREYGLDNFDFQVLETIYSDDVNVSRIQEGYWIEKMSAFCGTGYGYNQTHGGEYANTPMIEYTFLEEEKKEIRNKIKQGISFLELEKQYNISPSYLTYINQGIYFFSPQEIYPLMKRYKDDEEYDELIDLLVNTTISLRQIAKNLNMGYSTVKKINAGTLRPDLYPTHPIRTVTRFDISKQKADEAKKLLLTTDLSNKEIAELTGYSGGETIRQIKVGNLFYDPNLTYPLTKPVETMEGQSSSTSAIDTQGETGIATNDN